MNHPLVSLRQISKSFPGVRALDQVSFAVLPGEIHALMGENGAGKSTLMKILSAAYQPDEGTILIENRPVHLRDPIEAQRLGIGMIYQELTILPNLDVGRNILLGQEPVRAGGQVDWSALYQRVQQLFHELQLPLDPRAAIEDLSLGERQMVEIVRVAARQPRILIMDEPTSSLGKQEEAILFALIRRLQQRGVGIVYISHRLDEIFALADRITVLRDGKLITTQPASALTRSELIRLMVGREIEERRLSSPAAIGGSVNQPAPLLEARHLKRGKRLVDGTIALRAGEVVGLAGLVGAGRTQLARLLFGVEQPEQGEIWLEGKLVRFRSQRDAIAAGIAYVPEDRKGLGLVLAQSALANLILPSLHTLARWGVVRKAAGRQLYQQWVARLQVRAASGEQLVETLSGGNQQKIVLAKWLARQPRVLILNEPTRGIDVGAKAEVHTLIRQIAGQGVAVLMISSELPEILGVSDRIVVMHAGRVVGEVAAAGATEEAVIALAFGMEAA